MAEQGRQGRERLLQDRLDSIEKERTDAKDQLNRERLMRVTSEVIDTITSPEFVEKMRQARISADEGGGLEAAARLLSIDGLREVGVDIPADFRLTSRVFEDRTTGFKFELTDPLIRPGGLEPLGWGGCAGGGGLTFCGCGGFST